MICACLMYLVTCARLTRLFDMASVSNSPHRRKAIVIGAGIIGLSSAVVIAENVPDVDVQVLASRLMSDTTSAGAGGLWAPEFAFGLRGGLKQKLRELATKTWHHVSALARNEGAGRAGVFFLPFYKVYYNRQDQANHWWKDIVSDYRRISDNELKTMFPGVSDGYMFTSVVTDCTHYLQYLQERLMRAGGRITKQKVSSLHELADQCDVVVNCSGLGAQDLNSDMHMVPRRAQVVQVEAPWVHYAFEVEPEIETSKYRFYMIPRCKEVVLGGTQYHSFGTTVDYEDRDAILTQTAVFMPSLKKAKFKHDWVGLRPDRSTGLRLEKEAITIGSKQLHVIHNYGHSGQGITLHWGCALEAAKMAADTLKKPCQIMVTSKM